MEDNAFSGIFKEPEKVGCSAAIEQQKSMRYKKRSLESPYALPESKRYKENKIIFVCSDGDRVALQRSAGLCSFVDHQIQQSAMRGILDNIPVNASKKHLLIIDTMLQQLSEKFGFEQIARELMQNSINVSWFREGKIRTALREQLKDVAVFKKTLRYFGLTQLLVLMEYIEQTAS